MLSTQRRRFGGFGGRAGRSEKVNLTRRRGDAEIVRGEAAKGKTSAETAEVGGPSDVAGRFLRGVTLDLFEVAFAFPIGDRGIEGGLLDFEEMRIMGGHFFA